jgi:hypothetical protein
LTTPAAAGSPTSTSGMIRPGGITPTCYRQMKQEEWRRNLLHCRYGPDWAAQRSEGTARGVLDCACSLIARAPHGMGRSRAARPSRPALPPAADIAAHGHDLSARRNRGTPAHEPAALPMGYDGLVQVAVTYGLLPTVPGARSTAIPSLRSPWCPESDAPVVRWSVDHGTEGVTMLDNFLLLPPDDGRLVHKYRVYLARTARTDCTNSFRTS